MSEYTCVCILCMCVLYGGRNSSLIFRFFIQQQKKRRMNRTLEKRKKRELKQPQCAVNVNPFHSIPFDVFLLFSSLATMIEQLLFGSLLKVGRRYKHRNFVELLFDHFDLIRKRTGSRTSCVCMIERKR